MNVAMKLALAKKRQISEIKFEEIQSARITNPMKEKFAQTLDSLAEKII